AIFERRSNIRMLSATRGPAGLELARNHRPDLILLDLDLPGMQAPEILTRLQQYSSTREIPVVIVSADATPEQIESMLAAGAKDYLTKPINIANFLRTVDLYLKEKPVPAALGIGSWVEEGN
ncbi:response regulator, partial [bacterium]